MTVQDNHAGILGGTWSLRTRPRISALTLNVIVVTFILLAYNQTFWDNTFSMFRGDMSVIGAFGAAAWVRLLFFVSLLGVHKLQKPVLAVFILVGALSSYYLDTMGIYIDREMIGNIVSTTVNESRHLITVPFVSSILFWGVLPAVLVFWPRVERKSLVKEAFKWPVMSLVTFAVMAGFLLIDYKTISSVARQNRNLMASYLPEAPIKSALKYAEMTIQNHNLVVAPLGEDAHKGPYLAAAEKPVLTVVFVGETLRAQNWGLNGYERDTTPELRQRDVINFSDVSSCGTSTSISIPCMFSTYSQSDYSHKKHLSTENLLDVFVHAGVKAMWLDNNTGDIGVAKRTESRILTVDADPVACASGECNDLVFMGELQKVADTMTQDTVLVLHMIGSHGPAYYMRYPEEFETFKPTCTTPVFSECPVDQIVNAYDDTALFTDHVLAKAIDLLAAQDRVIPAMFFVSDHGESLGENGVYLHAAPWFMAPETQTKVPMVMWLSDSFKSLMALDTDCIAAKSADPTSQDIVFDTLLGLMNIETAERDTALDIVSGCRVGA